MRDEAATKAQAVASVKPINEKIPDTPPVRGDLAHRSHPHTIAEGSAM